MSERRELETSFDGVYKLQAQFQLAPVTTLPTLPMHQHQRCKHLLVNEFIGYTATQVVRDS